MVSNWGEYLRERRKKRRLELEQLPKEPCACGCGTLITPEDAQGRIVRYARGHSRKGVVISSPEKKAEVRKDATERFYAKRRDEIDQLPKIPCACGCGTLIAPIGLDHKPRQYVKGHAIRGKGFVKGGTPPNKLGDKPLTATERTKRRIEKKRANTPLVACACGCGMMINPVGMAGMPIKYVKGHNAPKGEESPLWRDGSSHLPYGVEFTRAYKKLIRERDNYICQRCGISQEEYGKTMHVHHLDHNKLNNDPRNLVTACGHCNTWASHNRDKPFITLR